MGLTAGPPISESKFLGPNFDDLTRIKTSFQRALVPLEFRVVVVVVVVVVFVKRTRRVSDLFSLGLNFRQDGEETQREHQEPSQRRPKGGTLGGVW